MNFFSCGGSQFYKWIVCEQSNYVWATFKASNVTRPRVDYMQVGLHLQKISLLGHLKRCIFRSNHGKRDWGKPHLVWHSIKQARRLSARFSNRLRRFLCVFETPTHRWSPRILNVNFRLEPTSTSKSSSSLLTCCSSSEEGGHNDVPVISFVIDVLFYFLISFTFSKFHILSFLFQSSNWLHFVKRKSFCNIFLHILL